MIREVDNKRLELPDRKEITLCEAVTAYAFGKALDSLLHSLNNETATKEQRTKARSLIELLQSAAYAGSVRFRALKNGDTHVDGHRDVDPSILANRAASVGKPMKSGAALPIDVSPILNRAHRIS
jgi:hypothetical protein